MIALALVEEDVNWRKNNTSRKRKWIHSAWMKRSTEGEFCLLMPHLIEDETKFYEYFRMTRWTFHRLLLELQEKLKKEDTFWRPSITPKERLAVCLRPSLLGGHTFSSIVNMGLKPLTPPPFDYAPEQARTSFRKY
ncbi:hypothetical protein J437_LFUL000217 [Ladona fulva]|uniref:Uncharacterized protein n=1 Tax=Ladona fulva TaxID=123851 RepID=A0A8K0JUZ4_LADFU|nr:hypothetical protein J437_LFUL000217 [Ladona fulva]